MGLRDMMCENASRIVKYTLVHIICYLSTPCFCNIRDSKIMAQICKKIPETPRKIANKHLAVLILLLVGERGLKPEIQGSQVQWY